MDALPAGRINFISLITLISLIMLAAVLLRIRFHLVLW